MKKAIIPNLLGRIQSVEIQEGETIETKVARITQNKEPITDSAPIIFTEKKDGVLPAYNIRTDRFDIALEAMDKIGRSKAKKENAPKPEDFGTWTKASGNWNVIMAPTQVGLLMSITPKNRVQLKDYPLEQIDEMRDIILATKGNVTSVPNKSDIPLYDSFGQRLPNGKLKTTSSQYGLCLKTYNSDLLQNW